MANGFQHYPYPYPHPYFYPYLPPQPQPTRGNILVPAMGAGLGAAYFSRLSPWLTQHVERFLQAPQAGQAAEQAKKTLFQSMPKWLQTTSAKVLPRMVAPAVLGGGGAILGMLAARMFLNWLHGQPNAGRYMMAGYPMMPPPAPNYTQVSSQPLIR